MKEHKLASTMNEPEKDQQLKVYVKDATFAWLPAVVLDYDGPDLVKVQVQLPPEWNKTTLLHKKSATIDKMERWVDLNDYHNHQLPLQNSKAVRDIAELAHLHEAAILYQIKARHAAKQPYTRVGEIVIAVNPCQWIDGLYTPDLQRLYAKHFVWQVPVGEKEITTEEKKDENIVATSSTSFESFYDRLGHEPHIYEVSASAYRGLNLDGRDQTILVSGESASGKTETVKLVLRHLSTIDMAALCADVSPKNKPNEDMINYVIDSSPVFEAFGNAKTCRNHNSSRFGKMTRIHFSLCDVGMYRLAGSSFVTYLLETSRVAFHSPGERCFHIFYQLLAASSTFKAEQLGDEWSDSSVSEFRYLSGTAENGTPGVTDADQWESTLTALRSFDWQDNGLGMLLGALGIIMRLGNLSFGKLSEGEARIDSAEELTLLAKIMGISGDTIEKAMTRRCLKTRQDELSVPLSCESAKEGCDALAKMIYCRVFASIVRNINEQTAPPGVDKSSGFISLVDIFGFESFAVNRFEQLCINYTNERLQLKYVQDNLQRHQVEYSREGLQIFDMKQFDNSDILELFEGPKGLINALSEESVLPSGNNASFVFKVKAAHKYHERMIDDRLHMKTEFGIRHFAGPVIYDASEFIERNSDKLPDSLLQLATQSSNSLVSLEFKELVRLQQVNDAPDVSRKAKMTTVMERFRGQLRELVDEMSETNIRYIRCIKPSETMSPAAVDHLTVMRQLRCAGLVTAIEITRETFPNKLSFRVVEDRFSCLLDCTKADMMQTMEPEEKCQFMMAALFAPEIKKFNASDFTMPYACGKTKVFYRAGSLEVLETARHEFLSAKATILQALARRLANQQRYRQGRLAVIALQAFLRSAVTRSNFVRQKNATVRLQTWIRCSSKRYQYGQMLFHGARLVAAYRSAHARRCLRKCSVAVEQKQKAATKIICWYRSRNDQSEFGRIVAAVVSLQSASRAKMIRDRMLIQKGACICIENWYSNIRQHRSLPKERRLGFPGEVPCNQTASSVVLHIAPGGGAQIKHVEECDSLQARRKRGDGRRHAATTLQAWIRSRRDRIAYLRFESSILRLQARYRHMSAHGKSFKFRQWREVPDVVELHTGASVSTTSADDLQWKPETDLESRTPDNKEAQRFVNKKQDILEEQLMRELEAEKCKVVSLELEIAQMRDDAERHAQEIESDFEDRVSGYEEEVLQLKRETQRLEANEAKQVDALRQADEAHKKSIQRLQYEIQKIQSSHRDYLDKIMAILDDTEAAQTLQISRINEELEAIKRDRDSKVNGLKEEIKLLRSIGFGAKTKQRMSESAQRLSRKLYTILAPDNLLLVVKEAQQQQQGTPQHLYIEEKLSSKARNMISYLEEIISVAEYEVTDARMKCSAIDDQVGALQQQLVCAYEEIEYTRDQQQ